MNNFLIGFYGKCDYDKFNRDFRNDFYGVEACLFPDMEEVLKLIEFSKANNFDWGVHYPLIRKNSVTRDPLFISQHKAERDKAFSDFEKEAELVSQSGGKYILTHFPKPVLVNDTFDFTFWRFGNDKEWMYARDYPTDLLNQNLNDMFFRLDGISEKYNIEIILENDAISKYLEQDAILVDLFQKYSRIKVCLDIGRLHLQTVVDKEFNGFAFAEKLAPYTSLIHLWNTSPEKNRDGGHLPVSSEQKSEDGFADVKKYLEIIFSEAYDVKVLFEHNSSILTSDELEECYKWVQSIRSM